jgi:general secretion pathway protein G
MLIADNIKTVFLTKLKQTGFTLIEVMLILMLLAIIVAGIIPFIFYTDESKLSATELKEQQNILIIKNALKFYKLDNGFYPSNAQGIESLVKKPHNKPIPQHWTPYLTKLPVDQWGISYQYLNDEDSQSIEVFSCGPPLNKQSWWYQLTHYFSKQVCAEKRLDREGRRN